MLWIITGVCLQLRLLSDADPWFSQEGFSGSKTEVRYRKAEVRLRSAPH